MNQFLPTTPAPSPPFALDSTEPSLVSPSTSTSSSWSMEEPQLFTPDATFWHDMSSYICASPKTPYEYCQDDASTSPEDGMYKVAARGSRRVRSKEQSPEVILRRRAQNRASQRAYRDRKDRRVKELETQLEDMSESNETLRRDHAELCAAHEKLKDESTRWRETSSNTRDAALLGSHDDLEGGQWRTESLSPLLNGIGGIEGAEKGLVVKVMICKRCFGSNGGGGVATGECEG